MHAVKFNEQNLRSRSETELLRTRYGVKEHQVDVIYIAGSGRSGSTLFDQLLGQLPGAISLGEVRHIWARGFHEGELCSCKNTFQNCSFWGKVADRLNTKQPDFDALAIAENIRYVTRPHRFIRRLLGLPDPRERKPMRDVERILQALYTEIQRASGPLKIQIDSSKEPGYASILTRLPGLRIHVVHLVRDPRAVAYSWLKKKERGQEKGERYMVRISPLQSVTRWVYRNIAVKRLKRQATSYFQVRYEDFVCKPKEIIQLIANNIGIKCENSTAFVNNNVVSLHGLHTVAGNPDRFKTGDIEIRPDSRWKTAMRWRDYALVTALTLPWLKYYGYSIHRRHQ